MGSAYSGEIGPGVWGDAGSADWTGIMGTADDANAGFFANNSPSNYLTLDVYAFNGATDMFEATNNANATSCEIDAYANLYCSGILSAVIPMDGGKRMVAASAIQSPVSWFEDAGSAQLVSGAAVVALDPDYMQTVNTEKEYQVFLTPYGDCKGLYVTNRTASSFEVHELGGGSASLSFGYRIMAVRKNYETVRFADRTQNLERHKLQFERMKAKGAKPQSHDPVKKPQPVPAAVRASR